MNPPCIGPALIAYQAAGFKSYLALKGTFNILEPSKLPKAIFSDIMCLFGTAKGLHESATRCFNGETFVDATFETLSANGTTLRYIGDKIGAYVWNPLINASQNLVPEKAFNARCYGLETQAAQFSALGTNLTWDLAPFVAIGGAASCYLLKKAFPYLKKPVKFLAQESKEALLGTVKWVGDKIKSKPTQIELTAQKVQAVEKDLMRILPTLQLSKKYEYSNQLIAKYTISEDLTKCAELFQSMGLKVRIAYQDEENKAKLIELKCLKGARIMFSQRSPTSLA